MLATLPRAGRRALTTASLVARAPLAPPYAHSARSSLAPPYAQHIDEPAAANKLRAPYAFALSARENAPLPPTPAQWVAATLKTESGRAWALGAWKASLAALLEQPAALPDIPFQALGSVLADPAVRDTVARTGGIVIRDVVRDQLAEAWASELASATQLLTHAPAAYHHPALVAARANTSVLSATSQSLRSLVPTATEAPFIQVDAVSSAPSESTWAAESLWETAETATGPSTPVHAHLALGRTDLHVPTSAAAATYALLRPYFAPIRSRISFYSTAGYLEPANWRLRDTAAVDAELTHVRPTEVSLAPGDVLVTHAGLRVAPADGAGLVLPVHPLPATPGNKAFVAAQRAAFEAGLPPPHVNESVVALEEGGDATWIDSVSGRRAMGYN
ncbi:hypothetical protein VHUM_02949 [Vanrija humicola]|uniref:Uncharacterized protein n=1 Tax=Vanrija humicola TaxID=5417 RepID=A0A7D8YVF7_VANHU|nr:hypothetical protein VHUM_02949 [Vanrija humicola]